MGTLRQWHEGGHAIAQVAFIAELGSPPPPVTVRELLALHPQVSEDYPRKQEFPHVMIPGLGSIPLPAFGSPNEMRAAPGEAQPGAFTFDRLRPNGAVQRSITLSGNQLSVIRSDYETWDKTWNEVRHIFKLLLPVLLERLVVTGFHLQFQDRFVWEYAPSSFRPEKLFRRDSPWLTPNVFEVRDFWHSHHGFFEYPNEPDAHQLLNVVETQLIPSTGIIQDSDNWLVIEIKLNHRIIHGVTRSGAIPQSMGSEVAVFGLPEAPGLIDSYMCEMHDKDKRILAALLNDAMCEQIRLDRPK